MKGLMVAGLIALSAGVEASHPNKLMELYEQLYPRDQSAREALDLCFLANHQFNRLDPAERALCYAHALPVAPPQAAAKPPIRPSPAPLRANFVDLWRAAGQGRLPQNDVRFQQQNDRYLHPGAARPRS